MSVYQVEEYYISMSDLTISSSQKEEITQMFEDENVTDYEFQDDNKTLVVDGFESEDDASNVEEVVNGIIE